MEAKCVSGDLGEVIEYGGVMGILWRTFEGGMEHEASNSNKQVAKEADEKYGIMTLLPA